VLHLLQDSEAHTNITEYTVTPFDSAGQLEFSDTIVFIKQGKMLENKEVLRKELEGCLQSEKNGGEQWKIEDKCLVELLALNFSMYLFCRLEEMRKVKKECFRVWKMVERGTNMCGEELARIMHSFYTILRMWKTMESGGRVFIGCGKWGKMMESGT